MALTVSIRKKSVSSIVKGLVNLTDEGLILRLYGSFLKVMT